MIAPTFEAHRDQYVAGRYSRDVVDYEAMERDADLLTRILARALYRVAELELDRRRAEETTMGRCYGTAA